MRFQGEGFMDANDGISVRLAMRWTLAAVAVAASGCDPAGNDGTSPFVIRVDSISAPAAISFADTLAVTFHGRIGPDQCSHLAHVEMGRGPDFLEIRFDGERESGGDCPLMPSALAHEERIAPPLEDPFTIRVVQPSGGPLEKIVRIE